jgi:hypothetical protein
MTTTYSKSYNNHPINTDEHKGLGCKTEILEKYNSSINAMISKHSKVIQVRFDLRYPQDNSVEPSPEHIHDFNYNLKRSLSRKKVAGGHKVDPQLMWAREQKESEHPHYHHLLLANGNAVRNYYPIVQKAEELWNRTIGSDQPGLVHYCDKSWNGVPHENGIMVRKGHASESEQIDKCYHQASYLAKERDKERKVKGAWISGSSRVKSK